MIYTFRWKQTHLEYNYDLMEVNIIPQNPIKAEISNENKNKLNVIKLEDFNIKKNLKIAWGITGAGHLIRESTDVIEKFLNNGYSIDIFFSKAGKEVSRMFGELRRLQKFQKKFENKINLIFPEQQEWSFPICGNFSLKHYSLLIISPATGNTIAKISYKIADSLITNIVTQSLKGNTPVIIIPTDFKPGVCETVAPIIIDHSICKKCPDKGVLQNICPEQAIFFSEELIPRIDLLKCTACQKCINTCPHGAITFRKKITINLHESDIERTDALKKIRGIYLVENPNDIVM